MNTTRRPRSNPVRIGLLAVQGPAATHGFTVESDGREIARVDGLKSRHEAVYAAFRHCGSNGIVLSATQESWLLDQLEA